MSIKGMQVSLKGVQLLQGGAVVSTAPTKLTTHSVRLVQFYFVGALETSAPPEYALFAWLVHLRQVHPLKASPESP